MTESSAVVSFSDDGSGRKRCHSNDDSERSISDVKKKGVTLGPFNRLGLEPFVVRAVQRLGFKLPTPIQRKTIPSILSGRDVVAMARTGSGKTAAFLLPIIQRLKEHGKVVGVRCIIFEPTRELAFQVSKTVRMLYRYTDLRSSVIVGGANMESQFERLANNPDILIACPGRLLQHSVETNLSLSAVEILVLDEADQMFEIGLGEQLEQLLLKINPDRQCILTSATLPSQLVDFAKVGLRSPDFIRLDLEETISPTLDMWFLYTRTEDKISALIFLLREVLLNPSPELHLSPGILVFVASRHHAEFLNALLNKAHIPNAVAYGSMDHQARCESFASFKKGRAKVLIVTDVAARGLDIPLIGAVVNFDFPMSPKHFIHRVGRTARAGRNGLAVSLVTRDEIAYAVELLLFAGLKFELPPNIEINEPNNNNNEFYNATYRNSLESVITFSSCNEDKKVDNSNKHKLEIITNSSKNDIDKFINAAQTIKRPPLYIGSIPNVPDDSEFVRKCLELSEFEGLYRTMMRSYLQYNKVRRQASRQSISRAKRLLEGDATKLLKCIHPGLRKYQHVDSNTAEILETLHSIRPKSTTKSQKGRQGGVLSSDVVAKMKNLQFTRNLNNFGSSNKQMNNDDNNSTVEESKKNGDRTTDLSESSSLAGDESDSSVDKIISDTKHSTTEYSSDDEKIIDVFNWKSFAKNKNQFFLSDEKTDCSETNTLRESHLNLSSLQDMESAKFDLVPDDERDQRKTLHVRKWNAQKRKYIMTPVDAISGKVLGNKQLKRRNEAGVIVRGQMQKTGVYDKWVKATHKRIQRVGEVEDSAGPMKKVRTSQKTKDLDDEEPLPSLSSLTNDKGLVEAIQKGVKLTHKEQRKCKKLLATQRGTLTRGGANVANEILTVKQLAKVKKETYKKKVQQNPKLRFAEGKKTKEKHMRKRREQGSARAAHRRSFPVPKTNKRTF